MKFIRLILHTYVCMQMFNNEKRIWKYTGNGNDVYLTADCYCQVLWKQIVKSQQVNGAFLADFSHLKPVCHRRWWQHNIQQLDGRSRFVQIWRRLSIWYIQVTDSKILPYSYVWFMSFGQCVKCRNWCWMSNISYYYLF